jgi:hypothetical protein
VYFRETYHVFNPIMRTLLEARVHRFISGDNDKLIEASIAKGLRRLRAGKPGASAAGS